MVLFCSALCSWCCWGSHWSLVLRGQRCSPGQQKGDTGYSLKLPRQRGFLGWAAVLGLDISTGQGVLDLVRKESTNSDGLFVGAESRRNLVLLIGTHYTCFRLNISAPFLHKRKKFYVSATVICVFCNMLQNLILIDVVSKGGRDRTGSPQGWLTLPSSRLNNLSTPCLGPLLSSLAAGILSSETENTFSSEGTE